MPALARCAEVSLQKLQSTDKISVVRKSVGKWPIGQAIKQTVDEGIDIGCCHNDMHLGKDLEKFL